MERETPAAGFRMARPARDRYEFDDALVTEGGHVIVSDFVAAQRVAHTMNTVRGAERFPEVAVRAGDLYGAGLLREIAQLVVDAYREEEGPELFAEALQFVANEVGAEPVEGTMLRFVSEFPPGAVYRGEEPPREYLKPHRVISLEELMLLWISNQNPAFGRFRELFHDVPLRDGTAYQPTIAALDRFFQGRPGGGPGGGSLLAVLQAPALASPTSIQGQLEFIRTNWADLLGGRFGDVLDRLLRTLDVLREERKRGGLGAGPPPIPDASALAGGRVGTEEYERFSADSSWMPRVVLLAKSTYVWLDQLARTHGREVNHLDQVPDEELDRIAAAGFTGLWLIGVWERSEASRRIKQMRGDHEAVASAYALHDYVIATDLGGDDAYRNLRDRAGQRGIRLASDMVPNHVGIDGRWVIENPDWFLALGEPPYPGYTFTGADLSSDPRVTIQIEDRYWDGTDAAVVFRRIDRSTGETRFIYHGNDGTAMPWNDTAQLDYLRAEVREGVIQTILHVARLFPIIRFDAAMTLAKRHIQRLWFPEPGSGGAIPSRAQHGMSTAEFELLMPQEFWREVVDRVAAEVPDTLLLAEAFWLMEGYFVRTLGMHRVYNSAFMHMMAAENNADYRQLVRNVLEFDPEVLKRFVNFMSNPDEETAAAQFGRDDKYFGVATVLATMPGLPMFGHGQVEGLTEKYGMEFRRAKWQEAPDEHLVERHRREIFPLLHRRWQFAEVGEFLLYDVGNDDVFAYSNRVDGAASLVLHHNKYAEATGRVDRSVRYRDKGAGVMRERRLAEGLGLRAAPGDFTIVREHRSGLEYVWRSSEIAADGLPFSLQAFEYRVYLDIREVHDDTGDVARLCRRLEGGGTPRVEDALTELRMEPLYAALRDVVIADPVGGALEGACAALRDEGEKRGALSLAVDDAAVEAAARRVSELANGPGEIAEHLPDATWRKAVAVSYQALSGLEAQHVREWRLTVGLRHAFAAAGLGERAEQTGRLVPLLLRHAGPAGRPSVPKRRAPAAEAVSGLLASLVEDPDALAFLGVNEHEGVRWFDRDAFGTLRSGLVTIALARADSAGERRRVARMSQALADAEARSGYDLGLLPSP